MTIAIGFRTIEGPKFEDCGGFLWRVRFHITQSATGDVPDSDSGGYVIQHVVLKDMAEPCPTDPGDLSEETYEMFPIATAGGGGFQAGEARKIDRWKVPGRPRTEKKWEATAAAYWVPERPSGFRERRGSMSTTVLSTDERPDEIDGVQATLFRKAEMEWNCCGAQSTWWSKGTCDAWNAWDTYRQHWPAVPEDEDQDEDEQRRPGDQNRIHRIEVPGPRYISPPIPQRIELGSPSLVTNAAFRASSQLSGDGSALSNLKVGDRLRPS